MTILQLNELLNSGEFHHATYRNHGTVWEGLWIYLRDPNGFRGFSVAGCFNISDPDTLKQAEALCRCTCISVGSYGKG